MFVDDYLPEVRSVLAEFVAEGKFERPTTVVAGDAIRVVIDEDAAITALIVPDPDEDWVKIVSALIETKDARGLDPATLLRRGALPSPLRYCVSGGWYAIRADALLISAVPCHFSFVLRTFLGALVGVHAEARSWRGSK